MLMFEMGMINTKTLGDGAEQRLFGKCRLSGLHWGCEATIWDEGHSAVSV